MSQCRVTQRNRNQIINQKIQNYERLNAALRSEIGILNNLEEGDTWTCLNAALRSEIGIGGELDKIAVPVVSMPRYAAK